MSPNRHGQTHTDEASIEFTIPERDESCDITFLITQTHERIGLECKLLFFFSLSQQRGRPMALRPTFCPVDFC